jgi:hypothetical protein
MKLRKTIFPIFVFAASLLLVACGAKKDQTPQRMVPSPGRGME